MEIKCEFDDDPWDFDDENERYMYTCNVTDASITMSGTEIKAFVGKHLPGKSNNDEQ
jgi:hypothetical protein